MVILVTLIKTVLHYLFEVSSMQGVREVGDLKKWFNNGLRLKFVIRIEKRKQHT